MNLVTPQPKVGSELGLWSIYQQPFFLRISEYVIGNDESFVVQLFHFISTFSDRCYVDWVLQGFYLNDKNQLRSKQS